MVRALADVTQDQFTAPVQHCGTAHGVIAERALRQDFDIEGLVAAVAPVCWLVSSHGYGASRFARYSREPGRFSPVTVTWTAALSV